jgi:hypothetical protein
VPLQRQRAATFLWLRRGDELEQQLGKIAIAAGPNGRTNLDDWELAAVTLLRGRAAEAAAQMKNVLERSPVTLRAIDTGRLYANVGRLTEAAAHLQRAFAVDASCAVFVNESPAFAAYRSDPILSALLSKYLQKSNR